jgi:hypothetical protein
MNFFSVDLACLIHQAEIYVREVGIKSLDR